MVGFIAVWQRVAFDATTVSPATCYLSPTYDADGNATLVKTATGTWQVTYNGENRPIRWENIAAESNNQTISNQTILTMSYDHMGRRREKNDQRFFYDGHLQIADNGGNTYVWDPTENVAPRPLAWNSTTSQRTHRSYVAADGRSAELDIGDVTSQDKKGYKQTPIVHEVGHMLGLSYPGGNNNCDAAYMEDAGSLMGAGMNMRNADFKSAFCDHIEMQDSSCSGWEARQPVASATPVA